jgi:hypothetical protein
MMLGGVVNNKITDTSILIMKPRVGHPYWPTAENLRTGFHLPWRSAEMLIGKVPVEFLASR